MEVEKMSQEYCPLCHIVIAPADPERVLGSKDGAVHLSCIMRREGKGIIVRCAAFLTEVAGELPAKAFAIEAGKATTPRKIAALLSMTLSVVYRRTRDRFVRQRVTVFAKSLGEQLTFNVRIKRQKKPFKKNGVMSHA